MNLVHHSNISQPQPAPSKEDNQNNDDDYDEDDDPIVNQNQSHSADQADKLIRHFNSREGAKASGKRSEPKLSQLTSISGTGGRRPMMGAPSSDKKKKKRKSR